MTFHEPRLLWLLAVPLLLLAVDLWRRRRSGESVGGSTGGAAGGAGDGSANTDAIGEKILTVAAGGRFAVPDGATAAGFTARRRPVRVLLALALALGVTALARPQWGKVEQPAFEHSREVLVALDLSRSMLANDVRPTRLERSRLLTRTLLDSLKGDRAGLIVFAGTAFLQVPLSPDYEIFREFLPVLKPDYIPQSGTNYAAMLKTALDAFSTGDADRFLVVLSDGEADPANPWRAPAAELKKRGAHVLALGVGTAAGATLPAESGGGLLKDDAGAVVLSRLEPRTLRELAAATGGEYRDASHWVDIAALIKETVAKGAKGTFAAERRARPIERFQWALAPALLLLLLSLWREFPVRPRAGKLPLAPAPATKPATTGAFGTAFGTAAAALLLAALIPSSAAAETAPPPPVPSPAAALAALVGNLAQKDALAPADAVALAEATLAYGNAYRAAHNNEPAPAAPVDDALEAVAQGERAAPAAADWQKLRAALEALKRKPDDPPQNEQKQDDKKEQQDGQKKDGDPKQGEQQQGGQQKSGEQEQKSGEPKQDGQKQDGQQKDGEQKDGAKQQSGQDSQQSAGSDPQNSQKPSGEQKSGEPRKTDGKKAFGDLSKEKDAAKDAAAQEKKDVRKPEDKAGEKAAAAPDPSKKPATGGDKQRVGGVTAGGDSAIPPNADTAVLQAMQRLQRVKKGDAPGTLFRRMQERDAANSPQPAAPNAPKGRTW